MQKISKNKIVENPKHEQLLEKVYSNIGRLSTYDKNILKNARLEVNKLDDSFELVGMDIVKEIFREMIIENKYRTFNTLFGTYHQFNFIFEKTGLKEIENL
jgi:hypothetical protein